MSSKELKLNTKVLREPNKRWLKELKGAKIEHNGVEYAKNWLNELNRAEV